MKASPALRTVAFVLVGLAALLGVATRIVFDKRPAAIAQSSDTRGGALRVGQALGDAILLNVAVGDHSVRFRATQCDKPITAVRFSLYAVAASEVADKNYGVGGVTKVDVYDGRVRENFSRFSKLFALIILKASDAIDGFYVRFYAPKTCSLREEDYVEWASEILNAAPASTPPRQSE